MCHTEKIQHGWIENMNHKLRVKRNNKATCKTVTKLIKSWLLEGLVLDKCDKLWHMISTQGISGWIE